VIRGHEQQRFRPLGPLQEVGQTGTGTVSEQAIEVIDAGGPAQRAGACS
jgi:hypothetical protein